MMGHTVDSTAANASRHLLAFPELYDWSYFGWVGVEIFFVISGFVIAFSAERATAFSFFSSRVVRLAPGVWICSSITLLTVVTLGVYDTTILLRSYRHSMAFLNTRPWIDGAFWTLPIEISFYFCVFLLILARQFKAVGAFAIFLGSCSAAFILGRAVVQTNLTSGMTIDPVLLQYERITDLLLLHHGVYFALGVLIWIHLVKKPDVKNPVWIALFSAAGCLEVAVQASYGNVLLANGQTLVMCSVWGAGVIGVVMSIRINSKLQSSPQWVLRFLKSAGLMTFPLYLVHTIAGSTIMGRLVMLGWSRWTALAVGMAIVMLVAFFVSTYLEPALQRWVKRLLNSARSAWPKARPA